MKNIRWLCDVTFNLLEGEKGAIAYSRKEERSKIKKARTIAFITTFTCIMAGLLLFAVNKAMRVDVNMWYILVVALFAIGITSACVSFQNAQVGVAKANRMLNKTINLQNTVKIKYVNITNVLDYNYAKYGVMNSYELAYQWEKYNEEKSARDHDADLNRRLEISRSELYQILKHYHISDPTEWVYQPVVLVDDAELKDVKKALVVQRQRLKKGIDFEMFNLESAKKEIQSLVREYPKYAKEVMQL